MDERILQWRVGIVVILAALSLGILIILFGEGWQSQYTLFIDSKTAPNVTSNTPVRKNGILIGRVSRVKNLDQGVRLTLRINLDEAVYTNDVCKIGTASLLGDAVINFVPGTQEGLGDQLTDRMMVTNVLVEKNPLELIDVALGLEESVTRALDSLTGAGDRVEEAAQGIAELTSTIQEAMGNEEGDLRQFLANAKEMSAKADVALESFNELMVSLNDIAGDADTRAGIKTALSQLPTTITEFETTIAQTRETIGEFRSVAERADQNLQNLNPLTEALGQQGPDIVNNLSSGLQQVEVMVAEITAFAQAVRQSKGSLGLLINDPMLYENLNQTVLNIRNLTVKLEPLLNDARYMVDGLARDPGQIVRGALDRRPHGTGPKGSVPRIEWNR